MKPRKENKIKKLEEIGQFINDTRETFSGWMRSPDSSPSPSQQWVVNWREAWHPDNVLVWGRKADNRDDSTAIRWFHGDYKNIDSKTIYQSSLTGKVSKQGAQIGRLWHRMYPVTRKLRRKNSEETFIHKMFFELLVIFPDELEQTEEFLKFLRSHPDGFELLWGNG
ncbi:MULTISPECIES: hypothetical protein [Spirulina sp. CCY15215]|uniref:hypothetical protein n=1 Tax=Spirulina sp. CCY15215 TaxID=2767591 RepID=UPI00194FCD16|nr:hypothetical protein [Spirulina major]